MSHLHRIIICPHCYGLGEHANKEACLAALAQQVSAVELSLQMQELRLTSLRRKIEELWEDVEDLDEAA
jgi:hypothetical protein